MSNRAVLQRLAILLVIVLLSVAGSAAAPAQAAPDMSAIDVYVRREMEANLVPGLALGIVQGDRITHLQGYGDAGEGRAVTPQTPFLLGSVSKPITALATMQLVEAGKIELDAPVQRYLPWFRVADPNASAAITVRHLLTQTSGLPTSAYQPDSRATIGEHVRRLATVELAAQPGERYIYSSPNSQILGSIIEAVSGQSYAAYIQEHVFAPLGMRQSYTSEAAARQNGMATGHRLWFGVPFAHSLYVEGSLPNGMLISSAEDMSHFLIASMNHGRYGDVSLLSAEGIAAMQQPVVQAKQFAHGMNWRIGELGGVQAIWHGGSWPNSLADLAFTPDGRWGVVALANVNSLFNGDITERIVTGVLRLLAGLEAQQTSFGLQRIYLLVAGVALVLVVWEAQSVLAFGRWRAAALRNGVSWRAGLDAAGELALPLVLLFGMPKLFGFSLTAMVVSAPDVAYLCLSLLAVSLIRGALKVLVLLGAARRPRATLHVHNTPA